MLDLKKTFELRVLTPEISAAQVDRLIYPGNSKLGKSYKKKMIWHFDLPSIHTCIYSQECVKLCYTTGGQFDFHSSRFYQNYLVSKKPDFAEILIEEIENAKQLYKHEVEVFRPHVSGDFYDPEYVGKWEEIIAYLLRVEFFFYTRSWQDPVMREMFNSMSELPNVQIWYSLDRSTGCPKPSECAPGIKKAYMLVENEPEPIYDCDLIFRVDTSFPAKKIKSVQVCPAEQGIERKTPMTCQTCQICL